uniref:Adhesion G protein-coupled receptor E5 n=1 Tax=Salvator merianae TaxID=96440 RepID=A0A8D0BBJ9_SALMN
MRLTTPPFLLLGSGLFIILIQPQVIAHGEIQDDSGEDVPLDCGFHASPTNSSGNHTCKCLKGFWSRNKPNGFRDYHENDCEDINECDKKPCDENAKCSNTLGSFMCTCLPGYFQYTSVASDGKNITKCREFNSPVPLHVNCSDGQAILCNFTAQLRNLSNSFLRMQNGIDIRNHVEKYLLGPLDKMVNEMKTEEKEQRHRLATEMMKLAEALLRLVAFAFPNGTTLLGNSSSTDLALEVRTAGSPNQSPAWLQQNETQMVLSWEAASKAGEALGLVGLLSYRNLGPVLADAAVEGEEWEQVGKSSQRTHVAGKRSYEVLSSVAAAFVGHSETAALSTPVNFSFSHQKPSSKPGMKLICAFWKPSNGSGHWSEEGCRRLDSSTSTTTHCQCNHLTSFAVLMAFYEVENWALDVITKVGLIVSLVCLFLAILTFLFCRSIRGIRTTIHLHLCLALFVAYVIFLIGVENTGNQKACAVVAGLLHFFFLSVFCWMLLEGVELYLMVIQVFNAHNLKHWHIFLVGYGLPAVLVGISAAINSKGYGSARHCWLARENGFLWSFLAPISLIIMVNAFVFVVTVWRLSQKFADINPDMSKLKKQRVLIITAIAQLCILGTTWVFGLFQFSEHTLLMSYIFTILNSLQGLFIFLLHCLLKKQVREDYYRWFCQSRHDKAHSSGKYSDFSSTAGSNTLRTSKPFQESGI